MATDKNSKTGKSAWGRDGGDGQYLAIGISIGLSLGVALSLVLDNWAFLGAGLAIGVAIGVSLDASKDKGTAETNGATGSPPLNGKTPDDESRPDGGN